MQLALTVNAVRVFNPNAIVTSSNTFALFFTVESIEYTIHFADLIIRTIDDKPV